VGEADRIGAEELDEMGTHHGGNGGNVPPDGDRPPEDPFNPADLPPGWDLTVPDDPSALAAEAAQVREELARKRLEPAGSPGLPAGAEPPLRPPFLIMSAAVAITLVSLFVMAWSGSLASPDRPGSEPGSTLPALALTDPAGRQVALTAQTPLVLMLVEECDCSTLIAATVAAAPPGVTVAAVGHSPPARPPSLGERDRAPLLLADPGGAVRAELGLDPPVNAATVVLVDQTGRITRTHPAATSVAQFQADLTGLAPA
jgi:hypothetical protein